MRRSDLRNSSGTIVICVFMALSLFLTPGQSALAEYPENPITFLCGWGAGGATDLATRALCEATSKVLGQPVVVINKGGSGSAVMLTQLKNQNPDGYTIGNIAGGGVINQYLLKPAYDVNKDFTYVCVFGLYSQGYVVRADAPWKDFRELVDDIKKNPGKLKFASVGLGTFHQVSMAVLAQQQNLKFIHIPYKGDPEAITALLGGHADFAGVSSGFIPFEKAGRVRLLTTFMPERLPSYPNVPTWLELGYDFSLASFVGVCGPKGMPKPVVDRLSKAFEEAVKDPNFVKAMQGLDMAIKFFGPEETTTHVKDMSVKFEKIADLIKE